MGLFDWFRLKNRSHKPAPPPEHTKHNPARNAGATYRSGYGYGFTGEKFEDALPNYFGDYRNYLSDPYYQDNYSLRFHSRDQYLHNTTAHNIIDTLEVSVIGGGLHLDPRPNEQAIQKLTGYKIEKHVWSEQTRDLFDRWANDRSSTYNYTSSFYELQRIAYRQFLIDGKVLAILRRDKKRSSDRYGQLTIQLLTTDFLVGYGNKGYNSHQQYSGQVMDETGTVIAYEINESPHFIQNDNKSVKVPRWTRDGRLNVVDLMRQKTVYDYDGYPVLTHILHDLNGLEKYRVAELQSAAVNAMIAMQIVSQEAPGVSPITGLQGMRTPDATVDDDLNGDDATSSSPEIDVTHPGLMLLHPVRGQEAKEYDTKRPNVNYKIFSDTVMSQVAASIGVPLEILNKQFSSNYSASRAAFIEFWKTVEKERQNFITNFCEPIYKEWLRIANERGEIISPGYLESTNIKQKDIQNAYLKAGWIGPEPEIIDPLKEAQAYETAVNMGWTTNTEVAKRLHKTDYDNNMAVKQHEKEVRDKHGIEDKDDLATKQSNEAMEKSKNSNDKKVEDNDDGDK